MMSMEAKVLVIDDDCHIRKMVTDGLRKRISPELIIEASSGNQAISMIKSRQDIGCVICDYQMEDGNGGDVFVFLRGSGIRFILFSSTDPMEMKNIALDEVDHFDKMEVLKMMDSIAPKEKRD